MEAIVVRGWPCNEKLISMFYNEKLISMSYNERLVSEVSISEVSMFYNERLAL